MADPITPTTATITLAETMESIFNNPFRNRVRTSLFLVAGPNDPGIASRNDEDMQAESNDTIGA